MTRSHHRLDIQGIRGLAVLLVVLYHTGLPVTGGFTGVDMFFVVSGFVITLMLLRELNARGNIDYRRFYKRRIRRLLPALALMLFVVAIASIALLGPLGQQQIALKTGVAATLFVANVQLITAPGGYFAGPAEANPFLHTWSLSVEEQFYLFLPVLLAVGWRITRQRNRQQQIRALLALVVTGLVIGSFVLSHNLSTSASGDLQRAHETAFYSSITRVWEFGVGGLMAFGVAWFARSSRRLSAVAGVAGIALVGLGAFSIGDATAFPGWAALLPVFGAALLLIAGTASQPNTISKALASKPMVWLGDRSYSWYLWHWPMIVMAQSLWPSSRPAALVASIISLGPTMWSYRLVEQPIRFGDRFPRAGGLGVAAVCIAVPLAGFAVLGFSSNLIKDIPRVEQVTAATRLHIDAIRDCSDTFTQGADTDCTWPTETAAGAVFLIGDSNAGQFTEPLIAAAADAQLDLTAGVQSACPFADVTLLNRGVLQTDCRTFLASALQAIRDARPAVVVMASASDIYIDQDRWEIVDPATGHLERDRASKARLWQEGLARVLAELESLGVQTVVVNPIPHFFTAHDKVLVDNCPSLRLLNDVGSCGSTQPRTQLEELRAPALDAELGAAAGFPTVVTVDFFDRVCPDTECTMYPDESWLYRDGTHLSVDGSLTLTGEFHRLLVAASG